MSAARAQISVLVSKAKPRRGAMRYNSQAATYRSALSKIPEVLGLHNDNERHQRIFLISCGRHKASETLFAKDLYTSGRFRNSQLVAETTSGRYLIISAKHGILQPHDAVATYDLSLASLGEQQLRAWSGRLATDLPQHVALVQKCVLLASGLYAKILTDILSSTGHTYFQPFRGLGIGYQGAWLKAARRAIRRDTCIRRFYDTLNNVTNAGSSFALRDIGKLRDLPPRGVYVFIDPAEPTCYSGLIGRVVRIGTHAISAGSKSTLRTRLRNHLGTSSGLGNHRGSIFRLRVGEALINKTGEREKFPTWGHGQHADSTARAAEAPLEREVSDYLEKLMVVVIPINDPPSRHSVRADVERQLIAMFTEEGVYLDRPSSNWLGRYESDQCVVQSGLWNVRDVGSRFDPTTLDLLMKYLALN